MGHSSAKIRHLRTRFNRTLMPNSVRDLENKPNYRPKQKPYFTERCPQQNTSHSRRRHNNENKSSSSYSGLSTDPKYLAHKYHLFADKSIPVFTVSPNLSTESKQSTTGTSTQTNRQKWFRTAALARSDQSSTTHSWRISEQPISAHQPVRLPKSKEISHIQRYCDQKRIVIDKRFSTPQGQAISLSHERSPFAFRRDIFRRSIPIGEKQNRLRTGQILAESLIALSIWLSAIAWLLSELRLEMQQWHKFRVSPWHQNYTLKGIALGLIFSISINPLALAFNEANESTAALYLTLSEKEPTKDCLYSIGVFLKEFRILLPTIKVTLSKNKVSRLSYENPLFIQKYFDITCKNTTDDTEKNSKTRPNGDLALIVLKTTRNFDALDNAHDTKDISSVIEQKEFAFHYVAAAKQYNSLDWVQFQRYWRELLSLPNRSTEADAGAFSLPFAKPSQNNPPQQTKNPFWKNPWFWGIGSILLGAAATSTYFILRKENTNANEKPTTNRDSSGGSISIDLR